MWCAPLVFSASVNSCDMATKLQDQMKAAVKLNQASSFLDLVVCGLISYQSVLN
uniref:Uncharacterized protein n=1 Tax=Oryza brachyantha TaxID=4533 RepID=J3MEN7_ORYBR